MSESHSHYVTRKRDDRLGSPRLGELIPNLRQGDRPGGAVSPGIVSVTGAGCLDDQCGCCIGHDSFSLRCDVMSLG